MNTEPEPLPSPEEEEFIISPQEEDRWLIEWQTDHELGLV